MKSRLLLPWSLLVGLFYLTSNAEAARATTLILGKSKPEPKIDTPPTAEEENVPISVPATSNLSNETINVGNVTKLTGVPQIDYIYDPNLPRELNGYNLTDYPFYNSVPEDIDFKCDGLHDGFYASVPHKCQVYHHCLFGTRYDFLCANYTAFDQKTFICHFASEVDCKNSPRYFNRNEALYKAATTTTVAPLGSSGFASARRPQQDSHGGRRRQRPFRKRKPSYEYYDEYEDFAEDDYYDEGPSAGGRRRKRPRPHSGRDSYDEAEEEGGAGSGPGAGSGGEGEKLLPNKSVYDRPRVAPKIRRPVPINEREKYDYSSDSRAIIKEPAIEKKRFEDTETANRKQTSNREPDYYESTGSGHSKPKEPDTEREREREHKEGDDYESDRERERDRDRDRDRERSKERDERPFRDRRPPPKKRRRPDDLDDDYDEYDDVRRHRTRNRPRYDEYDEYDYDDRPYRRNRDQEYRPRDHDYDRDKPYRSRDSDYDRPRPRDRIRDDERPLRNRDVDERPLRSRDDERPPPRSRDEERPLRTRESDKVKDSDDRLSRTRNDQPYRSESKNNKNRNREGSVDERYHYSGEEDRYRERGGDDTKRVKDGYRDEPVPVKKVEEGGERPYKYKEDESDYKQEDTDKHIRSQDRSRVPERPPRYRDSLDKFGKTRTPSREEPVEIVDSKLKGERIPEANTYSRPRLGDQTSFRTNERPTARPGTVQRTKVPSFDEEGKSSEEQSKPVPAARPSYITKPLEPVTTSPPRKLFNDQNGRKQNGFKRPFLSRVPTAPEEYPEQPEMLKPFPGTEERFEGRPFESPKPQERATPEVKEQQQIPQQQQQQPHHQLQLQPKPFNYFPQPDFKGTYDKPEEKSQPVKSEEHPPASDLTQTKLKVPHEESVPKEEFAPRAPKFPQTTSTRRRPFLPSRNGNANLPRGLLPVGIKALQTPRGFQVANKEETEREESKPEVGQQENPEKDGPADQRYKFPNNGGLEFRTKVSTAIGVDQPKLTQFFQDVQSSSELELPDYAENPQNPGPAEINAGYYPTEPEKQEEDKPEQEEFRPFIPSQSLPPQRNTNNQQNTQDLSSSHIIPEYSPQNGQIYRQDNNPNVNYRPTLKPMDFPQLSITDGPSPPPQASPQHSEERNIEQAYNHQTRNRPQTGLVNQQQQNAHFVPKNPPFFPPLPPKPAQPQLGPQTFYSENPKFKTTIKVPEQFVYKPTPPSVNFNSGTHLPAYQAGIRQNLPNLPKPEPVRYENAQRQVDNPQDNLKPSMNLKFPPQNENLDETDEYDVSLNDALQPISTLHPRNVLTGVFLSNAQRNHNHQQQPQQPQQQIVGGFKRRIHQNSPPLPPPPPPPSRHLAELEEYNSRKQEFPPQRSGSESRNVPNSPPRNQKFVVQRQAPSGIHQRIVSPSLYYPVRSATGPGKYFAVLTQ